MTRPIVYAEDVTDVVSTDNTKDALLADTLTLKSENVIKL
jgi:hypothetical protein